MDNGENDNTLHSLIPLADFKALLGIDDREDAIARYCLITATYTIEQYCMRRLYRKRHFERLELAGDLLIPLKEYPVTEILAVYALIPCQNPELIEPEFYAAVPDCGADVDLPFALKLSPAIRRWPGIEAVRVVYSAGYGPGEAPPDLGSACLELAAWNMSRYRGRRIGVVGAVRGSGKGGESLESSMPENVRLLLEPYKRRVI